MQRNTMNNYREEYAYSDTEAAYSGKRYNSLRQNDTREDYVGGDEDPSPTDEFGGASQSYGNRVARTGRQRKKLAARTKGGEFQARRRKRRAYFCCVGSDIDVQKLYDYLVGAGGSRHGWQYELYNDVLRLYKTGVEDHANMPAVTDGGNGGVGRGGASTLDDNIISPRYTSLSMDTEQVRLDTAPGNYYQSEQQSQQQLQQELSVAKIRTPTRRSSEGDFRQVTTAKGVASAGGEGLTVAGNSGYEPEMTEFRISAHGAQEIFVFDFGGVVFWGFSRGEETNLLKTVRMFVTAGNVGVQEFQCGEDDMAFFTSPDIKSISIANDVISLPEDSVAKQRLSVSFAIAQSSVLSIFEARIDRKIEEYKYIPETLAAYGKIHLTERQLGMMIGEVFVIRHDVNLHTEILDTPDFFWKQEQFEQDYRMVVDYLEMGGRTEILNKRLDMLRELLEVLQQQMETAHATKLEWIVIYLIVVEVLLQGCAILNTNGFFSFGGEG